MNKYQEALDRLANIDLQTYPSMSSDDFDPEDIPGPLYACECYREEFNTLQELIDKYEKYEEDERQEYEEWFEQQ